MSGNIPQDPLSGTKRKLELKEKDKEEDRIIIEREREKEELELDNEIDEIYEMGPTIQENNAMDFAQEYTRLHGIELKIEAQGNDSVLKVLEVANRTIVLDHTC